MREFRLKLASPSSSSWACSEQKDGRPVGGPAARAWGNGGFCGLKSVRFFVIRPLCCAREQQHDTQEQATDDHRSLPKEPNFLPITYRFCLLHVSPSIVPLIQFAQYSHVGLGSPGLGTLVLVLSSRVFLGFGVTSSRSGSRCSAIAACSKALSRTVR